MSSDDIQPPWSFVILYFVILQRHSYLLIMWGLAFCHFVIMPRTVWSFSDPGWPSTMVTCDHAVVMYNIIMGRPCTLWSHDGLYLRIMQWPCALVSFNSLVPCDDLVPLHLVIIEWPFTLQSCGCLLPCDHMVALFLGIMQWPCALWSCGCFVPCDDVVAWTLWSYNDPVLCDHAVALYLMNIWWSPTLYLVIMR